jgi:hypothetical protein
MEDAAYCVFIWTINDSRSEALPERSPVNDQGEAPSNALGEAQSMKNADIRKTQNWDTYNIESLNNKKILFQKIIF